MLVHLPSATALDVPELRALVLKAVAWGPPGETLSTVAAKLLHGELVAYAKTADAVDAIAQPEKEIIPEPILQSPLPIGTQGSVRECYLPLPFQSVLAHGISLLEFDPLGVVVNVAYLAAGPQVLGPFLDELAALALRYGFASLVCYSRRPGMDRLLVRHGWVADGAAVAPAPGFKKYCRSLPRPARLLLPAPAPGLRGTPARPGQAEDGAPRRRG